MSKTFVRTTRRPAALVAAAAALAWLPASAPTAQELSGDELVAALQSGGYVIVMRHAHSPRDLPSPRERAPGNVDGERQLSDEGKTEMTAMGYAFRELDLPVGRTLSSPAWRAVESAEYFGFGEHSEAAELGPEADVSDPDYLRRLVSETPPAGENTVVVTHRPLMAEAFGEDAEGLESGTSLIFDPGDGEAELVATVTIRDWAVMAVN